MSRLLPYETILKAREGDPEAVNAVLLHYAGYIRYFSKVNGQVNAEVEDNAIKAGMNDHVPKPIDMNVLLPAMQKLITRK